MLIREAINIGADRLKSVDINTYKLDSRILFQHGLNMSQEDLIINSEKLISDTDYNKFMELIAKRETRIPISRIIGKREFWGLEFELGTETLDPRPDSEILIEAILKYTELEDNDYPWKILDLGTGTGCLLLSALSELTGATGLGLDISENAIEIASKNAMNLGLDDRCNFVNKSWQDYEFDKYDIIISNPPYIRADDIAELSPEVKKHDPIQALTSGETGLEAYEELAGIIPGILSEKGVVILEIGFDQAKDVGYIFEGNNLKLLNLYKDLSGLDRCLLLSF